MGCQVLRLCWISIEKAKKVRNKRLVSIWRWIAVQILWTAYLVYLSKVQCLWWSRRQTEKELRRWNKNVYVWEVVSGGSFTYVIALCKLTKRISSAYTMYQKGLLAMVIFLPENENYGCSYIYLTWYAHLEVGLLQSSNLSCCNIVAFSKLGSCRIPILPYLDLYSTYWRFVSMITWLRYPRAWLLVLRAEY